MRRLPKGFGHWVLVVKEDVSAYERAVLTAGIVGTSGCKVLGIEATVTL